jgi:two-component sensor histidine kinase
LFSDNLENGEHKFCLSVEDDGVGMNKNIDYLNAESLGLQLINALVSQLEGTITLSTKKGTKFLICFS